MKFSLQQVKTRFGVHKACLKYIPLFLLLCIFFHILPYTWDDWVWGSPYAVDTYLSNWFDDYNGRYVGNLLILGLTRCHPLRVLYMAAALCLLVYLCERLIGRKRAFPFVLLSILLMPRELFRQTIAWTSGFVNYITSAIVPLLWLFETKAMLGAKVPEEYAVHKRGKAVFFLAAGFTGTLIMENVTLYLLAAALFVLAVEAIRCRKVLLQHAAFLFGCLSGALLMFSNSAYGLLSSGSGERFYRNVMIDTILEHAWENWTKRMYVPLFQGNTWLLAVLALVFLMLHIQSLKAARQKKRGIAGRRLLSGFFLCGFLFYCVWEFMLTVINRSGFLAESFRNADAVITAIGIVFFMLSAAAECLHAKHGTAAALLPVGIAVMTAPLFAVEQISARCFFLPYIFLVLTAGMSAAPLQHEMAGSLRKALLPLSWAAICAAVCFYGYIYGMNHAIDAERVQNARVLARNGASEVIIERLPYEDYLYMASPYAEWSQTPLRYKEFYGIPGYVSLTCVPYEAEGEWLSLDSDYIYFNDDKARRLTVSGTYAESAVPFLTWYSSDETVARVDENGVVKPIGQGNALITGTVEGTGLQVSCEVRIPVWLASVSSLRSDSTLDGVLLTWDPVEDATGYVIYSGRKANSVKYLASVEGTDTPSYLDESASLKEYTCYVVYPTKEENGKPVRGFGDQYIYDIRRLPEVSNIQVSTYIRKGQYSDVTLSWDTLEGADGYRIIVKRGENGKPYDLCYTSATWYTDIDAPEGITSYYWITGYRATDRSARQTGETGSYTQVTLPRMDTEIYSSPIMPAAVSKETDSAADDNGSERWIRARILSQNTVQISWNAIRGADGYVVMRNGIQLGEASDTLSYIDRNASYEQLFAYTVIPYVRTDEGNILGDPLPSVYAIGHPVAQVRMIRVVKKPGEVTLKWDPAAGANRYTVLSKKPGEQAFRVLGVTADTEFTDLPDGDSVIYSVYGCYADANGAVVVVGETAPSVQVDFAE